MASRNGANRPPAPPKRRAPEDQQSSGVVTYTRRRAVKAATPQTYPLQEGETYETVVECNGNFLRDGHQTLARHWISWRDTLEGFLKSPSLNQGGGIRSCIEDALRSRRHQPVQQGGNVSKDEEASEEHPSDVPDAKEIDTSVTDATMASLDANTAICCNALRDILVSVKFALLCDLLIGTLHVSKVDEVIDLVKIDVNMRNGNYAENPAMFNQDIQQLWEKFEQVGREMTGLASNLPIISRASYQKQVSGASEVVEAVDHRTDEASLGVVVHKIPKDSSTAMQLSPCDSGHSTIPKRICTCKKCGTNADEEKRLICDVCDTTYHIDCVKRLHPAMEQQIPSTWHCPACSIKGMKSASDTMTDVHHNSLHGDCPLCDKLDGVKTIVPPVVASKIELADEREGSSVPIMEEDDEPDLSSTALSNLCKYCGTCEDDDKKFLECGHPYCRYKFYHIRCLKTNLIASGQQKKLGCWYCPSCLCRGCCKDKDDEKIVMCDGCDEAYHTYCMMPKRSSVPRGQWFCRYCSVRKAREGMQKYEQIILKKHKNNKRVSDANQSNALLGDGSEK